MAISPYTSVIGVGHPNTVLGTLAYFPIPPNGSPNFGLLSGPPIAGSSDIVLPVIQACSYDNYPSDCDGDSVHPYNFNVGGGQAGQQGFWTIGGSGNVADYAMFGNGSGGSWAEAAYSNNVNTFGDGGVSLIQTGPETAEIVFSCPTNLNGNPTFVSAFEGNPQNAVPSGYSVVNGVPVGRYQLFVYVTGGNYPYTADQGLPWTWINQAGCAIIYYSTFFDIGPALPVPTAWEIFQVANTGVKIVWDNYTNGILLEKSTDGGNTWTVLADGNVGSYYVDPQGFTNETGWAEYRLSNLGNALGAIYPSNPIVLTLDDRASYDIRPNHRHPFG